MIYEKEVISIPATGTIDIIYKYSVHAHPVKEKGYNYKSSKYYTFRSERGIMEKVFSLEKSIILKPNEILKLDLETISEQEKERIISYIDSRKNKFGFDSEVYKFYLLKQEFELENRPSLPKIQSHVYVTLNELKSNKNNIERDVKRKRKTFLLTHNPNKWDWYNIDNAILELNNSGSYLESWSCGNSKKLQVGDRIFLVRLGVEPKGIYASGLIYDGVYKAPHWDSDKREKGDLTNSVNVQFDILRNPIKDKILLIEELNNIDDKFKWTSQTSGIEIPEEIAMELEDIWFKLTGSKIEEIKRIELGTEEIFNDERYTEGALTKIIVNKYERNLKARKECLKHYGYNCSICGVNLENIYGDLGKDFIHVHHIVPLHEIKKEYKIDPVKDLRPVCPNCHGIIHRRNPAYTIEEIKNKISNII